VRIAQGEAKLKKYPSTLWLTIPVVFLIVWGALAGQRSLGQYKKPLVKVFSFIVIKTPDPAKPVVSVQLWTAEGKPISHADVRFGTHPLSEVAPGQYSTHLDLTQFPVPMTFTITIANKPPLIPNPPAQPSVVIQATLNRGPNPVRITSPIENQVFHRSQTDHIDVQWQLSSPAAVPFSYFNCDDMSETPLGQFSAPAGTTSTVIPMSTIPGNCPHLCLWATGPTYKFRIEGPVTPDTYIAIGSYSKIHIGIMN
jgi:hypothetical protein